MYFAVFVIFMLSKVIRLNLAKQIKVHRSVFFRNFMSVIESESYDNDYKSRFINVARLYQNPNDKQLSTERIFNRLSNSHVCVIGLGGVGSWVVESLARSGIGK
jgi:hypothetical protein